MSGLANKTAAKQRTWWCVGGLVAAVGCAPDNGDLEAATDPVEQASTVAYCDSKNPQVHSSGKLVWCADAAFWSQHAADVQPYFNWADKILPTLAQDFGLDAPGPFFVVVTKPSGGASTPTPYGPGINITGDAFYNTAYGVKGFWAYLLITHEFVNQWTGLITGGGWPTDWWANHRSPFPNSMDAYLLAQLGQAD